MRTFAIVALVVCCALSLSKGKAAELDGWCAQATRPSSIVICADPELRHLAILRTKLFIDAKRNLPAGQYQNLLNYQNLWIRNYTSACGAAVDGPPVAVPVPQNIIDCYREAGRERVTFLISYLKAEIPYYTPPDTPNNAIERERQAAIEQNAKAEAAERAARALAAEQAAKEAAQAKAEEERQQAALQAAKARERLRAQAIAERGQKIAAKLGELGFQLITPVDLELDWRDLGKSGKKIALWGVYARVDDVDGLAVDSKDLPVIRLYTDGASRDARKAMLECRDSDNPAAACRMVIGGTVQACLANKGKINEREKPCIVALEAFVLPEGWQPLATNEH